MKKASRFFAAEFNFLLLQIAGLIPADGAVMDFCAMLPSAFALPQNPRGAFCNCDVVPPDKFAPSQNAFASFTRVFAMLLNRFAPRQTGFALPQNHCGAFHRCCENLKNATKLCFFAI